jgi:hypothetical protein
MQHGNVNVKTQLHGFLNFALDGREWSASNHDRFTMWKETLVGSE